MVRCGLAGVAEEDLLREFCERCNEAGLGLGRAIVFSDTLHPIHEGRAFRWCNDGVTEETAADYSRSDEGERAAAWRAEERPVTSVYVGLHIGEVFYGNIGSIDRLDFTVVGPAVNETSRIASMCRSVDRLVLISSALAEALPSADRGRLVSVGRFALRGIGRTQELFTPDRGAG